MYVVVSRWIESALLISGLMTNEEGESSQNVSAAIERLARLGPKVIDGTCKGKAIDFVGRVRRPKPESADDIPVRNRS